MNIFEQGEGDIITFPQDGFNTSEAFINGVKTNFVDYITQKNLDMRLPLVADYYGAMVNVSFQNVDTSNRKSGFMRPSLPVCPISTQILYRGLFSTIHRHTTFGI